MEIRVETIDYFLKRYREEMLGVQEKKECIERQLAQYEAALRNQSPGDLCEAAEARRGLASSLGEYRNRDDLIVLGIHGNR